MITKIFEVRDRSTLLMVVATKLVPDKDEDKNVYNREYNLLRKSGFGDFDTRPMVLLYYIEGKKSHYNPYEWGDRTLHTAHKFIEEHFDNLTQFDVIDVEFILGEADTIKETAVK